MNLSEDWKRLLRSSTLVLGLKVFGALAGYGFAFMALARLGTRGYGYFELGFTVLSILSVVAKWGLDGLLVREIPARDALGARHVVHQAMTASLMFSLVLAAGLWASAPWLEQHYGGYARLWMGVAMLVPAWTLMQVWSEVHRAEHRYAAFGFLQSSVLLGGVAVVLAAVPSVATVEQVIWTLLAVTVLAVGRGWGQLRRVEFRSLWSLRAPVTAMFLTGTLFMVMTWTDTLMLGYFLEPETVGSYRVAFKIGTLITFAQFAVNAALGPRIAALWAKGERAELQAEIYRVARLNALVSVPAFGGIMLLAPWLLSFFSPELAPYAGVLRVLALGQVVNALCGPVMYLLNMTGNEQSAQKTMAVAALANAVANLALIPLLGVAGAAWATSATMVLWNVWALIAVYRKTGIRTLIFWR
jgi:O-antigen/teichoic acid export membrane protein